MSNLVKITVPDLGDFRDVPVVELPVAVGDTIAAGDTLVVVESDKATLDVPAEIGGRIAALHVGMGDKVSEGTLLAEIEADQGTQAAPAAPAPGPAPAAAPAPEAVPHGAAAPLPAAPALAPSAPDGLPPHASPSIRKLARELGVDLARIAGTGPKSRITLEDVQGFVKAALQAPPAGGGIGLGLPDWPRVDFARFGEIERKPLSRIVRISGPALARNAIMIPHVTNFDEADVTDLEAFRKQANTQDGAPKLSILPFVVKAAVAALKVYPAFNSSLDGDDMVLKKYWNIGVAADTPDGLLVPVVKNADRKGLREIAAEMADLAADARAGRLKPSDMQGATFTISSLGGIGGTNFTPIINAPEVAILGITRSAIKPVWDGESFQPRLIQPLSLSWDHRAVDGVAAARFLDFVKDVLSDFRRISL
ncbi:2-oxo acid dehydrogenase subunit E2 [Aquamicrobium defluvii]|uniref:Dihydrolipoamide acetyltransferase component of pyruvate dehydrogenase complex n=1 Tax=Aquamicrobium defluvii TaxID=69279 RepID=A0A011UJB4_9HYPH|nr:2-oxo acid dehydrogenase subunit E2 [Aquamicrobium defluvii]EXL05968.1 branched-chain alpha-keto acid dehydrogenase subunit E2 [Aquamicrobium defluvii]EZQ14386.1 branched-chain alpha-keto acid dehydrogenase subunit E2 [Halopseudomonas bauzanensis]TDR33414.1 pyruvate dehydrogenase E2 component (dihydrolipoamide acetyltransferase) [Aquamicrobium defluvii]